MSAPAVGSFAQEAYDDVAPIGYDDANQKYALLTFLGALGAMFQTVRNLARDDADPGWSELLDVDACPANALPWLGQFLGVTVNPGYSVSDQRGQIRTPSGFARGTLAALKAAPAPYLTGTKAVTVRERDGDAYTLTVITYTAETTDSAKVHAALLAQKPAGLILNYVVEDGQDFETVRERYGTFDALRIAYPDFDAMRADIP